MLVIETRQSFLPCGGDDLIECIICRDNSVHHGLIVHDRDRQEVIFGDDLCNFILFIQQVDSLDTIFHESFHRRRGICKDQFLQGENAQEGGSIGYSSMLHCTI